MAKKIAVLSGDGIGPEIVEQGLRVLEKVDKKYNLNIETVEALVGGIGIDKAGSALPDETIEICKAADGIFFGAIGGPKWANLPPEEQPERGGLLKLRKIFNMYANLRPAIVFKALIGASPLKERVLGDGFDILFVRELTGGIYFGDPKGIEGSGDDETGFDMMKYARSEIRRIAVIAFESAMTRNKRLTSVDKANVLSTSVLWRRVVEEVAVDYPEVKLSHLYVDAAAMKLATAPRDFDVVLTGNLFGDILSDEASVLTGSLGMLPSASLADGGFGMYEPIHGSAPDIAGQGIANPTAQIMSLAMLLRYTYGLNDIAQEIEAAVEAVIDSGARTKDIAIEGDTVLSCAEFTDLVLAKL